MAPPVDGHVEPGFEGVRDAFAANLTSGRDVGAGCCVHVHGRKVVDLWGGSFDRAGTRPYGAGTLQLVFSTTKGVTAVLMALLVQRGLVDPEAPVAQYWPEFAAEGKGAITIGQLMSHQAGLPTIDGKMALAEVLAWEPIAGALAAQRPLWEPGTKHGYHALTYGWLAGEVIRRVTGKSVGECVQAELAGPLGLELWIGLPPALEDRVSPVIPAPPPDPEVAAAMAAMLGPDPLVTRALSLNGAFEAAGEEFGSTFNRPDVHAAQVPAANGITNARSLSRLYAALIGDVDGVRLLTDDTVERVRALRVQGPDACIMIETAFGLGFMLHGSMNPYAGPGSFGHPGAGGSVAFAQPERGLAFGYVMNRMDNNLAGDVRVSTLVDATLAAL